MERKIGIERTNEKDRNLLWQREVEEAEATKGKRKGTEGLRDGVTK
jgi:hypothetical protein